MTAQCLHQKATCETEHQAKQVMQALFLEQIAKFA